MNSYSAMHSKLKTLFSISALSAAVMLTGCTSAPEADVAVNSEISALPEVQPSMTMIGRYAEGQKLKKSMAEIVTYHKASQSILVINAHESTVDVLDAGTLNSQALANPLSDSNLKRRMQLDVAKDIANDSAVSLKVGGINSVAVSGDLAAVAVENDDKQMDGVIAFYQLNEKGDVSYIKSLPAGALPDNVQISEDGRYVVAANEGEPSKDYRRDPEGSITLITVEQGMPTTAVQLSFTDFNDGGARANELNRDMQKAGVRVSHPEASVAQDLEPEYVAFSADSKKAYVSMQENNAIAVVDLATAKIERIFGLGYEDHGAENNGLDASNKDKAINIQPYANVRGLYMPDTIASYQVNGVNYLVTANEGDSREYIYDASEADCKQVGHKFDEEEGCISWIDEKRVGKIALDQEVFNDPKLQDKKVLGRLKSVITEGDFDKDGDFDAIYSYGTRSFSIFNADTGTLVFDSGDQFEQLTAQKLGKEGFNAHNSKNKADDRSDDKGPEPEALALGSINDRTYAFIGLERTGGIMMYDITTPEKTSFVEYTINRDFSVKIKKELAKAGDLAPEGMKFVPAEESPTNNPLLIVGNEVSGTTSVYEVK